MVNNSNNNNNQEMPRPPQGNNQESVLVPSFNDERSIFLAAGEEAQFLLSLAEDKDKLIDTLAFVRAQVVTNNAEGLAKARSILEKMEKGRDNYKAKCLELIQMMRAEKEKCEAEAKAIEQRISDRHAKHDLDLKEIKAKYDRDLKAIDEKFDSL